jgi:hypothetical protein
MSVRVSSVFMLSYVGSSLETGLITRSTNRTDCLYDPYSRLILKGIRTDGLIRKVRG